MSVAIRELLVLVIMIGTATAGFSAVAYVLGSIILQRDPDLKKIKKALRITFLIGLLMAIIPLFIIMGSQPAIP